MKKSELKKIIKEELLKETYIEDYNSSEARNYFGKRKELQIYELLGDIQTWLYHMGKKDPETMKKTFNILKMHISNIDLNYLRSKL